MGKVSFCYRLSHIWLFRSNGPPRGRPRLVDGRLAPLPCSDADSSEGHRHKRCMKSMNRARQRKEKRLKEYETAELRSQGSLLGPEVRAIFERARRVPFCLPNRQVLGSEQSCFPFCKLDCSLPCFGGWDLLKGAGSYTSSAIQFNSQ